VGICSKHTGLAVSAAGAGTSPFGLREPRPAGAMSRWLQAGRCLAAAVLFAGSSAALAADEAPRVDSVAQGRVVPIDLAAPVPPDEGSEWVLLPVPDTNPTIGTGLRLVGANFFRADPGSQPSVLGAAAGYYDSGTWFAGVGGNLFLADNRWRVSGGLGAVEVYYDFYGAGSTPGGEVRKVPIRQTGTAAMIKVLRLAGPNLYVGAGYSYLDSRAGLRLSSADIPPELDDILGRGATIKSDGPILAVTYDSRDHSTYPHAGAYIAFEARFARQSVRSQDKDYRRVTLNANHYLPLGPKFTLGSRLTLCGASEGAPFFDLCLFGSAGDLRGYAVGQYQDRRMYALQTELRAQLLPRWGGVVFAGAGKVAPDFGSMNSAELLSSVGAGLRWMAAPTNKVNLRIDVARRKGGDSSLYVSVGEAF